MDKEAYIKEDSASFKLTPIPHTSSTKQEEKCEEEEDNKIRKLKVGRIVVVVVVFFFGLYTSHMQDFRATLCANKDKSYGHPKKAETRCQELVFLCWSDMEEE